MTKLELTTQLINLAVAGYFNSEKFTKERLNNYISKMCRNIGDKLYMEISLPDGRWLFKITQYADGEWDYYIPDTREQEDKLTAELLRKGA